MSSSMLNPFRLLAYALIPFENSINSVLCFDLCKNSRVYFRLSFPCVTVALIFVFVIASAPAQELEAIAICFAATLPIKSGFDIFIPIKNDSLNWIDNYEYCFEKFKLFVDSCKKVYSEIYISGFSDGGTGSYRIFYNHPDYFKGLINNSQTVYIVTAIIASVFAKLLALLPSITILA